MKWCMYYGTKSILNTIFPWITQRQVIGWEKIRAQKAPFLLASNHISHFDPPVITSLLPLKIDWMAVVELFQHPVAAAYFRSVDAFPTDRNKPDLQAVRTAVQRLKAGHVVGIYPEGGSAMVSDQCWGGAELKPGVATLAQMAGVPVVPCVVIGSDRLYNAKNWRRFRSMRLWVAVGEPLRIDRSLGKKDAKKPLEGELEGAFQQLVADLQANYGVTAAPSRILTSREHECRAPRTPDCLQRRISHQSR